MQARGGMQVLQQIDHRYDLKGTVHYACMSTEIQRERARSARLSIARLEQPSMHIVMSS